MIAVLRDLAEVVEHLAYSHTFRSEHAQQRVHGLLRKVREDLDAAAAVPAEQDEPGKPEPVTPTVPELNPAGLEIPPVPEVPGAQA